jgi:hypothetical protein
VPTTEGSKIDSDGLTALPEHGVRLWPPGQRIEVTGLPNNLTGIINRISDTTGDSRV